MGGRDHSTLNRERIWGVSVQDAWNGLVMGDGVEVRCQLEPTNRSGVLWIDVTAQVRSEDGTQTRIVARQSSPWPNASESTFLGQVWALLMALERGVEEWKRQRE